MLLTELQKITYLRPEVIGGRTLPLLPLWDGVAWHHWLDARDGRLLEVKIVDAARSNYVAKQAAKETDIWIFFVDLMWQRASWPEIVPCISGICDDFHAMGTSVAKLKHLFLTRDRGPETLVSSFAATELEYLTTVARSVFDLLQEAIAKIWNTFVRLSDADEEKRRRRHQIPDTFTKMVTKDRSTPYPPEHLTERYAMPRTVADKYAKHAAFFISLLRTRDSIVHGGKSMEVVFTTEKGFCVQPTRHPFSDVTWHPEDHYNDNIVSVLPWIAHIVLGTISACNDLMGAFAEAIMLPDKIAPDYLIFIRDPASEALLELIKIANGEKIWWRNASLTPPSTE
ncbi:hypothetical protein [Mesorhizobium sp. CN2-181]|uniref:hypothetical protein n=1 Tax=Mesorhizobium yinganensis TaxID=3157707 RepID=UPI0032B7DBB9